jgi:hypothetical protein
MSTQPSSSPESTQSSATSSSPITPMALTDVGPPELTDAQIKKCINRMVPYSQSLKGTPLNIQYERNKLMAMINSPVVATSETCWMWFVTLSPADSYDSRLFEIVAKDYESDWSIRTQAVKDMDLEQREQFLKNHPALSARLFDLKQKCFWDYVVKGTARPLGEITDTWRRIEFQFRGSPHCHAVVCVKVDGKLREQYTAGDVAGLQRVKQLIDETISCQLAQRLPGDNSDLKEDDTTSDGSALTLEQQKANEQDYYFNPAGTKYFNDDTDPRREPFDGTLNYKRKLDGSFESPQVAKRYRRLQLANQMHLCCKTCFKYCKPGELKKCRFRFVFKRGVEASETETVFCKTRDKNKRMKCYALPKRNNGHVNNTAHSALWATAHGGNHDIKFIDTPYETTQYAASYSAKPESADFKLMKNILARKMKFITPGNDRERLKAVANSLLQATQYGGVQACYQLLNLDIVQSSRVVINVNPLPAHKIDRKLIIDHTVLQEMDDEDCVFQRGAGTQLGRRQAYQCFVEQQRNKYGACHVTFYLLLTYFSLNISATKKRHSEPPLLLIDEKGEITTEIQKFQIGDTRYVRKATAVVVNLSPFLPLNHFEENSCFMNLLMHHPWPMGGEKNLAEEQHTVVDQFAYLLDNELFPQYIMKALQPALTRPPAFHQDILTNNHFVNEDDEQEQEDDEQHHINNIVDNDTFLDAEIDLGLPTVGQDGQPHPNVHNIPHKQMQGYTNFIANALLDFKVEYAKDNQIEYSSADFNFVYTRNGMPPHPVKDYANRKLKVEAAIADLKNERQVFALEKAMSHIYGGVDKQLLMFCSGQGGTGKSRVIELLTEICRLHYGKQPGEYGAVILAGPTGTSSHNISGYTYQSVFNMGYNKNTKRQIGRMSENAARTLGKKLEGAKVLVIDEIGMIPLEGIYDMSQRCKAGLMSLTEDEEERKVIESKPFGGLHVFFAGDFWQLKCMYKDAIYQTKTNTLAASLGRKLWEKLNEYVELIVNCRAQNSNDNFQEILTVARTLRQGQTMGTLLDDLNSRVKTGVHEARRDAPKALWISDTKARVKQFNDIAFEMLRLEGNPGFRLFARHSTGPNSTEGLDANTKALLFQKPDPEDKAPPYTDLCIGMQVACTQNIAVQIGIYNGSSGEVVGFGFYGDFYPTHLAVPPLSDAHKMVNRTLPVVFVRLDNYTGKAMWPNDPKVVAFTEYCDEHRQFAVNNEKYYRFVIPLRAAAATTTTKAQGLTGKNGVVYDVSANGARLFARSMPYVGCSRAMSLLHLHLVGGQLTDAHFTSHDNERDQIAQEYALLARKFPQEQTEIMDAIGMEDENSDESNNQGFEC